MYTLARSGAPANSLTLPRRVYYWDIRKLCTTIEYIFLMNTGLSTVTMSCSMRLFFLSQTLNYTLNTISVSIKVLMIIWRKRLMSSSSRITFYPLPSILLVKMKIYHYLHSSPLLLLLFHLVLNLPPLLRCHLSLLTTLSPRLPLDGHPFNLSHLILQLQRTYRVPSTPPTSFTTNGEQE